MARRRKKIQVMDYFDRYGFDDGNPTWEAYAREKREEIRTCLNELFRSKRLPYRAQISHYSSCHNSVRMEIHWDQEDDHFKWNVDYGMRVEAEPGSLIKYVPVEMSVPQSILDTIEEVQKMDVCEYTRRRP